MVLGHHSPVSESRASSMKSAKERLENLKLSRRPSTDLSAMKKDIDEKEIEVMSNRQRMLHNGGRSFGIGDEEGVVKAQELGNQICSQDFLGISSAPIQSRRLEWSFRRRRWISTERRSKHIYGTRQVKNVSEQLLLLITEVLLEKLFGFTTSADRKQFQSIGRWLNELHRKNLSMQIDVMKTGAAHSDTNAVTILVGNKSDLKDITT
ncbi:unnamed protein product [Brassica oleracea var. botrytis]|uniref:Uncharacterized protein n=2 Tax=Brassica oleracea TaxID=3712 RepID=A0A0D3CUM6_BRAOL|nr:unnamed protein product [Brassica oleracea]